MQPLARILDDPSNTTSPPELKSAVLDCLCFVLRQLKGDYVVFVPLIRKVLVTMRRLLIDVSFMVCVCEYAQIMARNRVTHVSYDHLVSLVYRDPSALDDPSLPMPGGWSQSGATSGPTWMLGDLMRDIVDAAGLCILLNDTPHRHYCVCHCRCLYLCRSGCWRS